MAGRTRVLIAVVWTLSLIAVAHWSARAQTVPPPGVEIRFVPATSTPGSHHGTLVGNFNGQWMPVTLSATPLPDPGTLAPRRRPR